MNRITRLNWEWNGNFEVQSGTPAMDKSALPLSSCSKCMFHNSDLNSNQILSSIPQNTDNLSIETSQHCLDISADCNRSSPKEQTVTPNSPSKKFSTSLHRKDLSYDDLSKNIDANLAEIDMETFRSEDINSILALPAIYSGHFDSVNHGEQCASVSGSLLNGLEIETSVGNRISEDEISICKDEPLFSPQREPPVHERTISVDSLDNSSSYDQDLVLTCKANKNNYTIVFEGSETQFSEDSEYHNCLKSSEVVNSASECANDEITFAANSMIQSDLVFTTWSNLKRIHHGKSQKKHFHDVAVKSKSLPNLSYQSAFFNDKVWQWAKLHGNRTALFSDLELHHPNELQVIRKCGYPYTLSLVKLFMKYKVSSRSSVFSSEHSSSTNSLVVHSLNNINNGSQTSLKIEPKDLRHGDADLVNQNYNIKNRTGLDNIITNQKRQLIVDNIRNSDWNPTQNKMESNNNGSSLKPYSVSKSKLHNSNHLKEGNATSSDCDNSQYFEDSLMEAPQLQVKNFNAMPIKEEEETDISSGDEVMKTSMSSDCNNCSTTSVDATVIKNNALDLTSNTVRHDGDHNLERIINIFPTYKANITSPVPFPGEGTTHHKDVFLDCQSQTTQTKKYNGKNCTNVYSVQLTSSEMTKVGCKPVSSENCVRYSSGSRDTSPNSSGYASSRHSSVERLQRSSVGLNEETLSRGGSSTTSRNVLLTTTKSCSTQVPVHVKDGSMQTSTLVDSSSSNGFTMKNCYKDDVSSVGCSTLRNCRSEHKTVDILNKLPAKEDKCIYVCFPNYSLPDLSFLKSISLEDSSSVFLSPTKFKPPQKITQTHARRPKSSDSLDSDSKKRLSNIKDWESLSVLLPDDLKHMLSQMHLKDRRMPCITKQGSVDSKSFPLSKTGSKIDLPEHLGGEIPINLDVLKLCSVDHNNDKVLYIPDCHSLSVSCKDRNKNHCKLKGQTLQPCNCQKCMLDVNVPFGALSNDAVKETSTQSCQVKNATYHTIYQTLSNHDKHRKNSPPLLKVEPTHSCSGHVLQKHLIPVVCQDRVKGSSGLGLEGQSSFIFQESKSYTYPIGPNLRHPPCTIFKTSHKCMAKKGSANEGSSVTSAQNMENSLSQNANCCDSKLNMKNEYPVVDLDPSVLHPAAFCRPTGCKNMNSDNFFEMEKAPQEFLVSPVQNPSSYPILPDECQMQNSLSIGNTLFHESLKRKTGLVENLQKATVLIYKDHSKNSKHTVSCCTSFSVGQKILTSLCPALHTILSDGLLPSVQGFFGPLPNSPWKVTEASIQLDESKKEIQDLLKHVNSEKLLTDSTYRFNAFVLGLLNLGCLEWWLGHLLSSQMLISHHYHPTALLSLLSLPASSHLQQELMELVSPLTNLTFNLDLAFETRIAAAAKAESFRQKCGINCCSLSKKEVSDTHSQKKLPNFTFCLAHPGQEKKCKKTDLPNSNTDILGPITKSSQIKEDGTDQSVWPGITINPFPNLHVTKKTCHMDIASYKNLDSKFPESLKYECTQKLYSGLKEKKCKKCTTDFSLYSSTDSGCSSQVCHSHDISLGATDSGESESHAFTKPDGHQFRKLQQKWEKITLGIDKPSNKKKNSSTAVQSFQNQCSNDKKSVEINLKRGSKCQVRIAVNNDLPRNTKPIAVKRALSQPPSSKLHFKSTGDILHERKSNTSDVVTAAKFPTERKNRSQIPTLKATKSVRPKSKIPVQKSGMRAQSASRDMRNLS